MDILEELESISLIIGGGSEVFKKVDSLVDYILRRAQEAETKLVKLQAIIDEANAQEHVAVIEIVHFDTSEHEPDEDRKLTYVFKGKTLEQLGIGKYNLYVHPIPAQQSTAVAVPDVNFVASTLMDAWKLAEPSHGITEQDASAESAFSCYIESLGGADSNEWHDAPADDVFKAGFKAGNKFTTITEAQVMEIASSAMEFAKSNPAYRIKTIFWLEEQGRALLEKLNNKG